MKHASPAPIVIDICHYVPTIVLQLPVARFKVAVPEKPPTAQRLPTNQPRLHLPADDDPGAVRKLSNGDPSLV